MEPLPALTQSARLRYADIVGVMQADFERSALARVLDDAARARWLYYNVFTVPWRSFEVLDVFRKQTRRQDFAGLSLLDLGAGTAAMDLFFLLEGGAQSVTALEMEIASLAYARGVAAAFGIEGLETVRGDIGRLPFAPERFDVVMSYDSLYVVGIPQERALTQARRVLRPGGTLVIKVMNRSCPPFRLLALPGVRRVAAAAMAPVERGSSRRFGFVQPNAPTASGLLRMLRRAGFAEARLYNRYTRSPSGAIRWILPHIIVAARRP